MIRRVFALAAVLVLVLCASAQAGEATDGMQAFVNKVLAVLRDPAYKAERSKTAQRKKLSELSDTIFDWVELSRRTLAINWNKLDVNQRSDFVGLYKQLLEKTYMDRIQDYKDEKVEFTGETKLDENQVEVQTLVRAPDKNIPINYRLINRTGQWRIYDVVVEGVSLVQNYRSQFNNILSSKAPKDMIDDLRQKVSGGGTAEKG